uniref:Uncharacterized protein n=1 Tax=Arundo donax TaxID=35708 RepID=A0A0A9DPQ4_ARUDO
MNTELCQNSLNQLLNPIALFSTCQSLVDQAAHRSVLVSIMTYPYDVSSHSVNSLK